MVQPICAYDIFFMCQSPQDSTELLIFGGVCWDLKKKCPNIVFKNLSMFRGKGEWEEVVKVKRGINGVGKDVIWSDEHRIQRADDVL